MLGAYILGEIIRVGLFMFVVYIGNVITAKTITFTGNSYPLMNFHCVLLTWVRMHSVREITLGEITTSNKILLLIGGEY
jgi:hypothetical protein